MNGNSPITDQEIDRIEAMEFTPCYAAGDTVRLTVHIFREGEVRWEPLCGKPEVQCGSGAEPHALSKFCPECWKEFASLRSAVRHDPPITTTEGYVLSAHWCPESDKMVLWAEKPDGGDHQAFHLPERDAVNLVYTLSTLLLDILDKSLEESDRQP